MDATSTTPPRGPADHQAPPRIAMILRPLYSRIIRDPSLMGQSPGAKASEPALSNSEPEVLDFTPQPEIFELIDPAALLVEADRTARAEPTTVAEARDLIRDPHAALEAPEMHRHVAWLVAGADLRHRRACAAPGGRTVA